MSEAEIDWDGVVVRGADGSDVLNGPVIVRAGATERRHDSLDAAFTDDPDLVLRTYTDIRIRTSPTSDLEFHGDWPFEDRPVRADQVSWSYTSYNDAFGEGDWTVNINDTETFVPLWELAFDAERIDPSLVGVVLKLDTHSTSMSTGDIGCTVRVDGWGGVWVEQWGAKQTYLGPVDIDDPVGLIAGSLDGLQFGDVATLTTELLDRSEIIGVLHQLGRVDWVSLTADVEVDGPGYETTVGELLEGGPG